MPEIRKVSVDVAGTDALAYAAGDAVGGLLEFAGVVDFPGKGGRIRAVEIIDLNAVAVGITLQLFDRVVTPTANNAAYAPSDADAAHVIGNVAFVAGDFAGGSANKIAHKTVDIPFETVVTRSIYGQLFTQGAPTYAASVVLKVVLLIEQEEKAGRE